MVAEIREGTLILKFEGIPLRTKLRWRVIVYLYNVLGGEVQKSMKQTQPSIIESCPAVILAEVEAENGAR